MIDNLQDDELAKADLRTQERLEQERAPYETLWKEIDELYPHGAGGFDRMTPGAMRGEKLFDPSHLTSLERFAAAGVAITTPEQSQYIRPKFLDPDLNKLRTVQLWSERTGERLYGIRHALHTGFITAAHEDWDQLGRYGTSPMWTDRLPDGRGLFYRALHLSECYIDTDFSGLVNRVHRKLCKPVEELAAMFGEDALTPKMQEALADPSKRRTEFEVLHVVAPNTTWDEDKFDYRRFPIGSRYLAIDEKLYVRRKGYNSMPISVSRHTTSPGEKYGRSPAMKMLPTTKGLQAMRRTTLRAAHKAVDPALLFNNDDGAHSLVTRPGGLNPGMVDEMGRPLVARMPGGEAGLPFAEQEAEFERGIQRTAFLEEFYKILTDPNSRMTTTEVLEVMSKQGVLVRPFANRYATEKQHPVSQRELDLALAFDQIEQLPPEVIEAGAFPVIEYENPLAAMARAESTTKSLRFMEALIPLSAQGKNMEVFDWIDQDTMIPGIAQEIGVKPSYVRSPEQVAALRAERNEQQAVQSGTDQLGTAAGAYLDVARANQISEAA